ncbi:MAG TPA: THUMP domain-containing protein, partial [Candidatus Hodarchaeales archaeon]|nr:THUMP domain-containing protein [Candidatus Hodarchaeales archaeon]
MLDEIFSILQDFPICAACLGRQYGSFLHGISNRSRGEALFLSLGMSLQKQVVDQIPGALVRFEKLLPVPFGVFHQSYPKIAASALIQPSDSNPIASVPTASLETMPTVSSCKICRGLLDVANLERYALQIDAHSQYYEFASYLVGSRISADIVEREEDFRAKFKLSHGESIKSDCNREIGKILQKFPRFAQKKVEFETPDLVFVVDFGDNIIRIQNNPLFILGKYMKLVRGIPQSVWFCRECWGKGCD